MVAGPLHGLRRGSCDKCWTSRFFWGTTWENTAMTHEGHYPKLFLAGRESGQVSQTDWTSYFQFPRFFWWSAGDGGRASQISPFSFPSMFTKDGTMTKLQGTNKETNGKEPGITWQAHMLVTWYAFLFILLEISKVRLPFSATRISLDRALFEVFFLGHRHFSFILSALTATM